MGSSAPDILKISSANYNIINEVSLLRPRVSPRVFVNWLKMKKSVGDNEIQFSTQLQQAQPIFVL
jgi:hypothetical protein